MTSLDRSRGYGYHFFTVSGLRSLIHVLLQLTLVLGLAVASLAPALAAAFLSRVNEIPERVEEEEECRKVRESEPARLRRRASSGGEVVVRQPHPATRSRPHLRFPDVPASSPVLIFSPLRC